MSVIVVRSGLWLMALATVLAGLSSTANAQPPAYDEIGGAMPATLEQALTADNSEATESLDDPTCEFSTIFKTIWFSYSPIQTRTVVARAVPGEGVDVEMAVLRSTSDATTLIGCEDRGWEEEAENMRFQAEAGSTYFFMVGNARANQLGGSIAFDVHRSVQVGVTLDDVGWVSMSDGNAAITGGIRCSASQDVAVEVDLAQLQRGTDPKAHGNDLVTCTKGMTRPWIVRTARFQGTAFRSGHASLTMRLTEDQDGTDITRSRVIRLVTCTKIGSLGDDRISGTRRRDRICGLYGNDVLRGRGGRDVLHGHFGDDLLYGAAGRDKLFGGPGNDRLYGGASRNRCEGGSGRDRLISC